MLLRIMSVIFTDIMRWHHGGNVAGPPQISIRPHARTLTIQMPESLAKQICEWADREGVSVYSGSPPLRPRS
jgi:hypothetical protein